MATEVAAQNLTDEEKEKYAAIRHSAQGDAAQSFIAVRRGETADVAMVGLGILAGLTLSFFATRAMPGAKFKVFPVLPSLVGLGLMAGGFWWRSAACHRSTLVGTGAAMLGGGVFFAWEQE